MEDRSTPEVWMERQKKQMKKGNTPFTPGLNVMAQAGLLPTPTTQEPSSHCEVNEQGRRMTKDGKDSHSLNLGRMVTQNLLPTPTSDDNPQKNTGKRNQDGLQKRAYQTTGKTSQLNPRFVAEMMGFPTDWTILPFLNGETKA